MGLRPVLLSLLLVSACSPATDYRCTFEGEPDYAASAGCLTVVHNKVLLVDSRTWRKPGWI